MAIGDTVTIERDAPPGASSPTTAPHPEEMRATMELRIGNSVSLNATARATPAGLATAALLASAILVPVLWFAKQKRIG
jgi:hypothetical protein